MSVEVHVRSGARLDAPLPGSVGGYTEPKKGAVPEPAQCSDCDAVYYEGRWRWGSVPLSAHEVRCPACERLRNNKPAAWLTLEGASIAAHRDEMKRVALQREASQRARHPLQRIMRIEDTARGLRVTTTDLSLARDIGEALREAYGGALDFEYDQQGSLRVRWER